MRDYLMLIDGEMTAGDGNTWIESHNPATLAPLGRVPDASASDVDRAVQAAAEAQLDWARLSVWERAGVLRRLAGGIRDR
jgi:acyl-CoA reductase-like NAD-dependent aldehyde dehydrogenase